MSTGQYGWIAIIVLVLIGAGVLAKNLIYIFRLRKVALTGHCWAQMALGCAYRNRGMRKMAIKWWRIAAEKGEPNAELRLGTAYLYGQGVRQNADEAFHWIRRSAEQGFAGGQSMLSVIYSKKENLIAAYAWSSLAAKQNHPMSADFVQQLEEEMESAHLEQAKLLAAEYAEKFCRVHRCIEH